MSPACVQALQTSDMHFAMMALMVCSQRPMVLMLGPYGIMAACGLDEFAAKRFAQHPLYETLQGRRVHALLTRNKVRAAHAGAAYVRDSWHLGSLPTEAIATLPAG